MGYKHTKESREKIRLSKIGKKRPPFSKIWIQNISKSVKERHMNIDFGFTKGNQYGKGNTGIKRSPEHIEILRKVNSNEKSHLWKGGGSEWKKKQARIRDDYTCNDCGLRDPEIVEVDHRIPRFEGGADEIENLVTLCPNCHRRKTNREKEGPITIKDCLGCGQEFGVYTSRNAQEYCSRGCANKSPIRRASASAALIGRVLSKEHKLKISNSKSLLKVSLVCRGCRKNFMVKPSRSLSAKYCSVNCIKRI